MKEAAVKFPYSEGRSKASYEYVKDNPEVEHELSQSKSKGVTYDQRM